MFARRWLRTPALALRVRYWPLTQEGSQPRVGPDHFFLVKDELSPNAVVRPFVRINYDKLCEEDKASLEDRDYIDNFILLPVQKNAAALLAARFETDRRFLKEVTDEDGNKRTIIRPKHATLFEALRNGGNAKNPQDAMWPRFSADKFVTRRKMSKPAQAREEGAGPTESRAPIVMVPQGAEAVSVIKLLRPDTRVQITHDVAEGTISVFQFAPAACAAKRKRDDEDAQAEE